MNESELSTVDKALAIKMAHSLGVSVDDITNAISRVKDNSFISSQDLRRLAELGVPMQNMPVGTSFPILSKYLQYWVSNLYPIKPIAVFGSQQDFASARFYPESNFIRVHNVVGVRSRLFSGAVMLHGFYEYPSIREAVEELKIRQPELFK